MNARSRPAALRSFPVAALGLAVLLGPAAAAPPPRPAVSPEIEEMLRQALRAAADCRRARDRPCAAAAEIVLGEAFGARGDEPGAQLHFDRALLEAQRLTLPALEARALLASARLPSRKARGRGLDLLDRAGPLARAAGDVRLLAAIQCERGEALASRARASEAFGPLGEALRVAERERDAALAVRARMALARVRLVLGRPGDAMDEIEAAFAAATAAGLDPETASALLARAELELDLGRLEGAARSARAAAATFERAGMPLAAARALARAVVALDLLGDSSAEAASREAVARLVEGGDLAAATRLLAEQAAHDLEVGRLDAAAARLAEGERLAEGGIPPAEEAMRVLVAGELARRRGDLAHAERELRRATGLADRSADLVLAARARGRLAALSRALGRDGEAIPELRRALDQIRRAGGSASAAGLWSELALAERQAGSAAGAARAFDAAVAELGRPQVPFGDAAGERLVPAGEREAGIRAALARFDAADPEGALVAAEALFARLWLRSAASAGVRVAAGSARPGPELVDALREALPAGSALLVTLLGEERGLLVSVERSGVAAYPLPSGPALGRRATTIRALAAGGAPLRSVLPHLRPLSEILLAPFAGRGALPERVFVVADEALAAFPFELLPVGARRFGRTPLLGDVAYVAEVPSVTAWLASGSVDAPRAPIAAEGAFVHRDPAAEGDLVLRVEATRRAAKAVSGTRILLAGDRATPREFLTSLPQAVSLLHLGVAARLDGIDPSRIALVLDDGRGRPADLSLHDLAARRIETDLATIAAARPMREGARGAAVLASALLAAGSRGVLLPAGEIPDGDGAAFLGRVHRGIAAGLGAEQAVALARRGLLSEGGETGAVRWSAFRMFGDGGGRVRARRSASPATLVGALATTVLLLGGAVAWRSLRAGRRGDGG